MDNLTVRILTGVPPKLCESCNLRPAQYRVVDTYIVREAQWFGEAWIVCYDCLPQQKAA